MQNTSSSSEGKPGQGFPQTQWTRVLAAARLDSEEGSRALESLCRAYWQPLYCFARRSGQSPQDAQDLTQEFFRHLLQKGWLDKADPAKGRLRNFLITLFKNFMRKEWRRESSSRRGGGLEHVALDTQIAESRIASYPGSNSEPDAVFDREWALTLLKLTMSRLELEMTQTGRNLDFNLLRPCLTAEPEALDYAAIASQLKSSEGTVRVATHRMRKRFRALYREELAQTLAEGEDVDAELRHLASVL